MSDVAKELRLCSVVMAEGGDYRTLEQIKKACAAGAAEIKRLRTALKNIGRRHGGPLACGIGECKKIAAKALNQNGQR